MLEKIASIALRCGQVCKSANTSVSHASRVGQTCFARPMMVRHCSAVLSPVTAQNEEKNYSPKIQQIVNDIKELRLHEVADLNELLKKTLNISDAPMMAMGAAPVAAAAPAAESEEAEKKEAFVQTEFTVNLLKYDESKKVALIKAIKSSMTGLNLVQAKKLVESAPQILKESISQSEAEQLKQTLEAQGATVVIE